MRWNFTTAKESAEGVHMWKTHEIVRVRKGIW